MATRASVVLACVAAVGCGMQPQPGTGEKIGQIVRIERTGIFCQTWEAQIIRGGLSQGSGTMGAAFGFTVNTPELAEAVTRAMRDQSEVLIRYRSSTFYSLCSSDSGGIFLEAISAVPTK